MRECERKERQERGGERERKEIYRRAKAYPAVACARDKDRAKWLFLWSIGGRPYKISSEWRSLFTGRRPTRDSVVGSLSLALSLSRPRTLIVVLSCLLSPWFSLSLDQQPSRSGKRKGKRKKERRRRARIVATRESPYVFPVREKSPQCIHRSCPSVSPRLDSSCLSLLLPHHTSFYLSSPRFTS